MNILVTLSQSSALGPLLALIKPLNHPNAFTFIILKVSFKSIIEPKTEEMVLKLSGIHTFDFFKRGATSEQDIPVFDGWLVSLSKQVWKLCLAVVGCLPSVKYAAHY